MHKEIPIADIFAWKNKNSAVRTKDHKPVEVKVLIPKLKKESRSAPTNPKTLFKQWRNTPEDWIPLEQRKTVANRVAVFPKETAHNIIHAIAFNMARIQAPIYQTVEMLLNMNKHDSELQFEVEKLKKMVYFAYHSYKEKAENNQAYQVETGTP